MANLDEINGEISRLESQAATYASIERLAWLYIVRDHLSSGNEIPRGESEYMCACAGKTISQVMEIMDEMMETIHAIHPRLYAAVMDRLR